MPCQRSPSSRDPPDHYRYSQGLLNRPQIAESLEERDCIAWLITQTTGNARVTTSDTGYLAAMDQASPFRQSNDIVPRNET